jgi:hypothetical protein
MTAAGAWLTYRGHWAGPLPGLAGWYVVPAWVSTSAWTAPPSSCAARSGRARTEPRGPNCVTGARPVNSWCGPGLPAR